MPNFCPTCGAELKYPDAEICPSCGVRIKKSTLSKSNVPEEKNPLIAVLCSFFIPGLGQIYNGEDKKGVALLFGTLIGALIFLIPGIVVWIYGMYDAYKTSEKMNSGEIPNRPTNTTTMILFAIFGFIMMIVFLIIGVAIMAAFILGTVGSTTTLSQTSDTSRSYTPYPTVVYTTKIPTATSDYSRSYTSYPTAVYTTKIPTVARDSGVKVRIIYPGSWQGAVGDLGSITSVQGSGTTDYPFTDNPKIISANAQKKDDSSSALTIQIIQDGNIIKQASTTASYGVAQVSAAL